ncbi:MAG: hypothetical protein A2201_12115 [Alicyclobacillus sp. RIFOXYA1_FULL_53_8]|nr:MAG: hypothetical protein A2201_12115 [Alicyclobacillus sp. RIFOXYA1_FULL_53_8]
MNSKRRTDAVSDALAKITLEPSKHEGLWSQIERRIDAHESLSSQVGTQFKQKTVKRRFVFGQVWAAVAAILVVALGLFAGMHRNDLVTKNQSSVTKPKYPLFTPPRNMIQSLTIASPDGHLRLVGYNSSKNAAYGTVQDFYVLTNDIGKSPQVLYHVLAPLYFISNDSFWFTEGSHEYLAILRFNNVGETLFIQGFAKDGRGIWITTQKEKQIVTRGLPILSKLDAKHLLLGNYGVRYETPVIYSFNANGVLGVPATQQFPSKGEVPNSTTRTLYVSETADATGSSTFKITADLAPLRMRI